MGKFVEKNLLTGEQVLYEGKVSLASFWHILTFGAFIALTMLFFTVSASKGLWHSISSVLFIIIIISILLSPIIAFILIQMRTTELAVTNKRVIAKWGLIKRGSIDIRIEKIESVRVDQSIVGRLLNFGSLVISGAGNPQAPIIGIADPLEFRKKFYEICEQVSEKRTMNSN